MMMIIISIIAAISIIIDKGIVQASRTPPHRSVFQFFLNELIVNHLPSHGNLYIRYILLVQDELRSIDTGLYTATFSFRLFRILPLLQILDCIRNRVYILSHIIRDDLLNPITVNKILM